MEVMSKNLQNNTSEFIEKSIKIHGDKFDYSKVEYNGSHTKVCIICPEHGEFYQLPSNHLSGKECFKCSYKKRGEKKAQGKELFIEKSIKTHGDKYDYSKVEYVNSKTKVCIICNKTDEITGEKHNEFWQTPYSHLSGTTCPKCTGHFMNQEIFIKRANVIHKNKYNYSKVDYKASIEKVCIICPEHGEFLQTPTSHLSGQSCPKCSGVYRYNTNEWIEKTKKVHGERYNYSKVVYVNNSTKICIICKEHGEFWQTPANHILGKNCPKCTGHFMDKNFFLDKAKEVYKDKNGNPLYDYSLVDYKDSSTHVTIICHKLDPATGKEHGEFSKTPNKHLSGQGCPLCGNESGGLKNRLSNEEFLKKAFTDEYEYLTKYETAKTKIHIKCKKCGHKFWQEAFSHLSGCGCPICNESKLEKEVTKYLNEQCIRHEKQKKFEWLGRQSLDFYLPDYNKAIECQGIQHFESKDFFGGDNELAKIVKRDNSKLKKCLSNNIEMIYVIDNEKYLEKKYHFDIVEPFSDNVSYDIIHINHFENYIKRIVEISHFFG
jgi:hypothetical protein